MTTTTTYEDLKPTQGDPRQSHQYMLDIAVVPIGAAATTWRNVPDITGFNPSFQAVLQEITTYAHKGEQAQSKVGATFNVPFNILPLRDNTGEFQPEWLLLKNASDQTGEKNMLKFRYYDTGGASDAYEGTGTVARDSRPENGPVGVGWDAFTLAASGRVSPIVNPLKA